MKLTKLFIAGVSVLLLAINAHAASLSYSPDSFSLTMEAGESATLSFRTTLNDSSARSCLLSYSLRGETLASWAALPRDSYIYPARSATVPSQLGLMVPAQASPGTYSGYLIPVVSATPAESVAVGRGIQISVTVLAAGCAAVPEFTSISHPEEPWSPNNKSVDVEISGTCTVPEGCTVSKAWYVIDDEYGTYGGSQEFAVSSDGSFNVSIPIEASRKGDDMDGRLYTLIFYAENEAGIGKSPEFYVRIAHDQKKK